MSEANSAAETVIHYTVMQFAKKIRGLSRVPFLLGYKIYPLLAVALFIVAVSKKLPFLSSGLTDLCGFKEMHAALLLLTSVSVLLALF